MKTLTSGNSKNPHTIEISDKLYASARSELGFNEVELFHFLREYSPTKNQIDNIIYLLMAIENRAAGCKASDKNPGAWMWRKLSPTKNSFENGYFRHKGEWKQKEDQEDGSLYWENEKGERPSYSNAESSEVYTAYKNT